MTATLTSLMHVGLMVVGAIVCHTDHYWQVYFDTNRTIRESCGERQFPVPERHFALRTTDSISKGEAKLPEIGVRTQAA